MHVGADLTFIGVGFVPLAASAAVPSSLDCPSSFCCYPERIGPRGRAESVCPRKGKRISAFDCCTKNENLARGLKRALVFPFCQSFFSWLSCPSLKKVSFEERLLYCCTRSYKTALPDLTRRREKEKRREKREGTAKVIHLHANFHSGRETLCV